MEIVIEKGIPMPVGMRNADLIHALVNMKSGDSFMVPSRERVAVVRTVASRLNRKVISRIVDGGYRIWMK